MESRSKTRTPKCFKCSVTVIREVSQKLRPHPALSQRERANLPQYQFIRRIHETWLQDRGVPRPRSCVAFRPITFDKCLGARPCPGRIDRTLLLVKVSPALTSSTT